MLSSFGAMLLELLDERDMGVPELAEALDQEFEVLEIVKAITDPLAPLPVGMLLSIADALALDSGEDRKLIWAARADASWRLTCHREGWAYW